MDRLNPGATSTPRKKRPSLAGAGDESRKSIFDSETEQDQGGYIADISGLAARGLGSFGKLTFDVVSPKY